MIRLIIIATALLAFSGCSRLGGIADETAAQQRWQARQQALRAVERWDIHARAALRLEGEAYQIGIRWQRTEQDFTLLLEAPFGQGVIRIDAVAANYRLLLPDGRSFVNDSPEALLDEVLGWSLPIGGLEYWIRGLPWPGSTYAQRNDSAGRSLSIRQDRWTIRYLDYFDADGGPALPRRLNLARDQLALKLVIERWQPIASEDSPSDLFPVFN